MKKRNTKQAICEVKFNEFANRMTQGFGKIEKNFINDMLLGISKSKSVLLSEIARNSVSGVQVKKSVERFSRQLCKFDSTQLEKNRIGLTKEILPEHKLYILDDSELVKSCATKMEALDFVRDGSDDGKLKLGYHLSEIVCVSQSKQPASVHSELYSVRETRFSSANAITRNAIAKVVKTCGNGLFVCDRGFDDVKLFEFFEKMKQKYIIRVKNNRDIFCDDMVENIDKAARKLKGKFSFSINFQAGKKENLKASFKKVYLPKMITTPLYMVVVYGFSKDEGKPFYVLTNLKIKNKEDCIKVVRGYLYRWKIEEYFKFKKQCYEFEDVRIRSLKALKNLNLMLTAVITFLAILGNSELRRWLITLAQPIREKVIFEYYRLLAGFCILSKDLRIKPQKPPPKPDRFIPKQYDFFYMLRYRRKEFLG